MTTKFIKDIKMTNFSFKLLIYLSCFSFLILSNNLVAQETQTTTTTSSSLNDKTTTTSNNNLETTTSSVTTINESDEILTSTVSSSADSLGSINSDEANSTIIINVNDENSTDFSVEGKSISTSDNNNNNYNEEDKNSSDKNEKLINLPNEEEMMTTTTVASANVAKKSNKNNKKLNMTNVDRMYNDGRKSEEQIVDSWLKMGKRLKKAIGSIIGSIVPHALNMTQEARISNDCSGAMLKWVLSMNHLKAWALRMLDASGKPVAGLLEGSLTMFGNYRQCLKIRAPDDDEIEFAGEFREYFRGKYCVIQAKPWLPQKQRFYSLNSKIKSLMETSEENEWYDRTVFDEVNEWLLAFNYINIRMDLCIPSLCSREDIQSVLNFLLKDIDFKARVLRCEMDSQDGSYSSVIESSSTELADALIASASTDSSTSTGEEEKTIFNMLSQLGWLLIPILSIVLVLSASFLSFAIKKDEQLLVNNSNGNNSDDNGTIATSFDGISSTNSRFSFVGRKVKHTIRSFSLKTSIDNHLNVDYDQLADEKPLALYGIRFLLIMWVLIVEFAINLKFEYLRELLPLKDLIFWWPLQVIINSTIQYDSIILLTAFTMSYKYCLNNNTTTSRSLIKYILDKYIRLMPSIMITVAFTILLPLLYRGPVWNDYVTKQSAICQSSGWLNMIFLQNYLQYKEICLPHTWLLCVEIQLILLMAPILYYLNKSYLNETKNSTATITGKQSNDNNNSIKQFFWLKTKAGLILLACIALGSSYSFYNVYSKDLPPSYFYTMPDPDSKSIYFSEHFMKLWTHLAVFAIGILAGIECRRATRNVFTSTTAASGFKGLNLNNNYQNNGINKKNNGLENHYQQQHNKLSSTSTTSLPIISRNSESLKSFNDNNNNKNESKTSSSVSININNNNNGSHENINAKQNGAFGDIDLYSVSNQSNNIEFRNNNDNNYKQENRKGILSFILDLFGCLVALAIMGLIIFSTYDWSMNDLPKPFIAGLYDSGSRLLWSLAFIWLLYMACVPNKKDKSFSFISKLLGHPSMVCLGKLSFLIYLIHPLVHITVLAIQEQPIYSSWLMLFHILIGNMTITIALASFISLFVEMPCRNLFRRAGTSLLLTEASNPKTTCNFCHS